MHNIDHDPSHTPEPPIWRTIVELIGITGRSLIVALAIVMFIMQVTTVEGFSMEPNLTTNQRVLIDKISFEFFEPERGDVVVIEIANADLPLIKRVIGLAGETVQIIDGLVHINGVLLDEGYQHNIAVQNHGPIVVPAEHIFVMGDNRPVSRDSRSFGPVDIYRIIGKARFSIWPPEQFGVIP